jgi:hypothetical protein
MSKFDPQKGLIIDLNNSDITASFKDYKQVNVEWDTNSQQFVVRGHQVENKIIDRETVLKCNVKIGQLLRAGSLFAGIGLLCRSIHRDLKSAIVSVQQRFANEREVIPAEVTLSSEIWADAAPDSNSAQYPKS